MRKRTPYSEQLQDPRWKAKREKIIKRAHNQCQICARTFQPFHVHHSYYENGKKAWEYPDYSLLCVCKPCHDGIHTLLEFSERAGKVKHRSHKAVKMIKSSAPREDDYIDPNAPKPTPEQVEARFKTIFDALGRVEG